MRKRRAAAAGPVTPKKRHERVLRGDRVRRRREDLGWTQLDLAYRAKLVPRQVSDFERGMVDPSASALRRMALALAVSCDWLLGLSDRLDAH